MLLHCASALLLGSASRHTVFMPHVAARFNWDQWPRRVIQQSDILKPVGAKSLLNSKKFQMRVGSTTTGLMAASVFKPARVANRVVRTLDLTAQPSTCRRVCWLTLPALALLQLHARQPLPTSLASGVHCECLVWIPSRLRVRPSAASASHPGCLSFTRRSLPRVSTRVA